MRQLRLIETKVRNEKLYLTVLLLLPVGFTGLGLIGVSDLLANISVADLLMPFLLISVFLNRRYYRPQTKTARYLESSILKFSLPFLIFASISIWNLLRYTGPIQVSLLSVFKLLICLIYSFLFLLFIRQCDQRTWERFITAAAASGIIFSIACLVGVVCYFLNIPSAFVENYHTSFRATGFQEDPNLAAIFQVMSISYVLAWMRITKLKRAKYIALLCVFLGALSTTSKACIITIAITSFCVLILSLAAGMKRFARNYTFFLAMALLIMIFLYLRTSVLDSLASRLVGLTSGDATTAMTGRNIGWKTALDVLIKNPANLIFGVGIGQFQTAADAYGLPVSSYAVHNTFLSFFVECGIVQVLLVAGLLFKLIKVLIKNIIKKKDTFSLYMFWGVLSVLIFMNSLNFQNNRMAYIFIMFVYVSQFRLQNRELSFLSQEGVDSQNDD